MKHKIRKRRTFKKSKKNLRIKSRRKIRRRKSIRKKARRKTNKKYVGGSSGGLIEEQLIEITTCPICVGPLAHTVSFKCGHLLCWFCADQVLNRMDQPECPLCKKSVEANDLYRIFPMDDIVTKLVSSLGGEDLEAYQHRLAEGKRLERLAALKQAEAVAMPRAARTQHFPTEPEPEPEPEPDPDPERRAARSASDAAARVQSLLQQNLQRHREETMTGDQRTELRTASSADAPPVGTVRSAVDRSVGWATIINPNQRTMYYISTTGEGRGQAQEEPPEGVDPTLIEMVPSYNYHDSSGQEVGVFTDEVGRGWYIVRNTKDNKVFFWHQNYLDQDRFPPHLYAAAGPTSSRADRLAVSGIRTLHLPMMADPSVTLPGPDESEEVKVDAVIDLLNREDNFDYLYVGSNRGGWRWRD